MKNPPDEFEDMQGRCLGRVLPNLTTRNMAVSGSNSLQHAQWVRTKLERQPDDGFGLVVIRAIADELLYNERRNEVVFVKYLDEPAGPSSMIPSSGFEHR